MSRYKAAKCHPDRKHKAFGLCLKCYENSGHRWNNSIKAKCHPSMPHQAHGLCKPCYMKRYLTSYKRPEDSTSKRREESWRRKGLNFTDIQYNELLCKQGNKCAICNTNQNKNKKRLSVDHDHTTGKIRGLLCDYCNRRLMIKKNTLDVFKKAVQYLESASTPSEPPTT